MATSEGLKKYTVVVCYPRHCFYIRDVSAGEIIILHLMDARAAGKREAMLKQENHNRYRLANWPVLLILKGHDVVVLYQR